jgi:hypothetical protein
MLRIMKTLRVDRELVGNLVVYTITALLILAGILAIISLLFPNTFIQTAITISGR